MLVDGCARSWSWCLKVSYQCVGVESSHFSDTSYDWTAQNIFFGVVVVLSVAGKLVQLWSRPQTTLWSRPHVPHATIVNQPTKGVAPLLTLTPRHVAHIKHTKKGGKNLNIEKIFTLKFDNAGFFIQSLMSQLSKKLTNLSETTFLELPVLNYLSGTTTTRVWSY